MEHEIQRMIDILKSPIPFKFQPPPSSCVTVYLMVTQWLLGPQALSSHSKQEKGRKECP